tara:strand:+ start:10601 stop:11650 length:1050 start_codon:yes stop_codon:yes gene_type:complete
MNELTNILVESVDRLLRDLMMDGMPSRNDQARHKVMWDAIQNLGITDLFLTEENGGFSGSWTDAFAVFSRLGYHAIPLPVGETIVAKGLLQKYGMETPKTAITLAIAGDSEIITDQKSQTHSFSGTLELVPWGESSEFVLVQCQHSGRDCYLLMSTKNGAPVNTHRNEADEPRDTIVFSHAPVAQLKILEKSAGELYASGALLRTCQAAGALEAALELSTGYVQERKQFGRSISKFQVIQHQLALLVEEAAAVSCAAQSACKAFDMGDGQFEIAAAKLRSNRAVNESTSIAHQVHGAIGFTKEHQLHYSTQRLWSWRSEFGNDRYWAQRLGNEVLRSGRDSLWPRLTAN